MQVSENIRRDNDNCDQSYKDYGLAFYIRGQNGWFFKNNISLKQN